ncbi:MAG: NAD(P)H-dependent oxidoreductase subunit E, partial [Panacibacter sp.]
CYVLGCDAIYEKVKSILKIKYGETTADEKFTLLPNACLGCCDHAPALMIDDHLYQDIKEEELSDILNKYE